VKIKGNFISFESKIINMRSMTIYHNTETQHGRVHCIWKVYDEEIWWWQEGKERK
jgi:hypothetical protein